MTFSKPIALIAFAVMSAPTFAAAHEDQPLNITAGQNGAKVWIKTGHLIHAKPPVV